MDEDPVQTARIKACAWAMYHFRLDPTLDKDYRIVRDASWFVVDASKAEPDVNWPGELISEHPTEDEGRLGLAKAVLEYADRAAAKVAL